MNARFWKMSLGNIRNPEEREVFDRCIETGHVALGYGRGKDFSECVSKDEIASVLSSEKWDEKGPDYTIKTVDTFKNQMKVGDFVIITDGNLKFRAIGRVKGEYQFLPDQMV